MSDAKTVVAGHQITYVEIAPVEGGLAADLCPGEHDLIEQAFFTRQLRDDSQKMHPNPNHDSLFLRFEQLRDALERLQKDAMIYEPVSVYLVNDAIALVSLIRAEVLK